MAPRSETPDSEALPRRQLADERLRLNARARAALHELEEEAGRTLDVNGPANFFAAAPEPLVRVVCPRGSHGRAASVLRTTEGPLFVALPSMPPAETGLHGGMKFRMVESKNVLLLDLLELEPDNLGHPRLVAGCRCGRPPVDREAVRASARLALHTRPQILKLQPEAVDTPRPQ